MKRFLCAVFFIFPYIALADTMNLNWIVDRQTYAQTTCTVGSNLTLPAAPTKYGYTFQGWRPPRLVEYVQSSGNTYVNTGFYANQDTRIVMDCEPVSGSPVFFGARTISNAPSNSNITFNEFINTNSRMTSDYGTQRYTGAQKSSDLYSRLTIDKNKNVTTWKTLSGTVLVNRNHTYRTFQQSYPVFLLKIDTKGTPEGGAYIKLYGVQIYNDSVLVRDFVPVLDGNNVACLYDLVTKEFFYGIGSSFTAGPEVL